MSATPEFIQKQYEFTRHCRDPENNPAPANIEDRRMAIYRDLLYNNIEGFMSSNFPVIREIMNDGQWQKLIRNYFSNHKASTPLFPKLPTEFLSFLENEFDQNEEWPFLIELAHYEWVESALAMDMREIDDSEIDQNVDIFTGVPVINTLLLRLAYEYPVHRIGASYIPAEKPDQQTYLVVYRDREDKIGFMELNPVTARLLERIGEDTEKLTGQAHLQAIAEELNHPQPEIVINAGLEILQQMQQRDILLGAKNPLS